MHILMLLEARDLTVGEGRCKLGIGESKQEPAVLEFISIDR